MLVQEQQQVVGPWSPEGERQACDTLASCRRQADWTAAEGVDGRLVSLFLVAESLASPTPDASPAPLMACARHAGSLEQQHLAGAGVPVDASTRQVGLSESLSPGLLHGQPEEQLLLAPENGNQPVPHKNPPQALVHPVPTPQTTPLLGRGTQEAASHVTIANVPSQAASMVTGVASPTTATAPLHGVEQQQGYQSSPTPASDGAYGGAISMSQPQMPGPAYLEGRSDYEPIPKTSVNSATGEQPCQTAPWTSITPSKRPQHHPPAAATLHSCYRPDPEPESVPSATQCRRQHLKSAFLALEHELLPLHNGRRPSKLQTLQRGVEMLRWLKSEIDMTRREREWWRERCGHLTTMNTEREKRAIQPQGTGQARQPRPISPLEVNPIPTPSPQHHGCNMHHAPTLAGPAMVQAHPHTLIAIPPPPQAPILIPSTFPNCPEVASGIQAPTLPPHPPTLPSPALTMQPGAAVDPKAVSTPITSPASLLEFPFQSPR